MKTKIDILVLEDDPDLCVLLETMLKFSGMNVKAILNPALLHGTLEQVEPKLLLMDMLLSGSDGRDICRSLKSDATLKHIKIMMISAHPDAEQTCRAAGANDFLGKPFDMDEFINKVKKLIA